MNTAKQIVLRLIDGMRENEMVEIIDFIGYLKTKKARETFKDLELASQSSTDFWLNDIDDEVWNNA